MNIEEKSNLIKQSRNKLFIFILVSFFALQNLTSIILFKLNFPYSVDYTDIFVPLHTFIVNGENTFLINKNIHVILVPKLIAFPNFFLNSFDVVNISYLIWILISLTVFFLYLIIKQTDKKLIWTIIPISVFLYSPLTTHNSYGLAMLSWFFPMFGMSLIVYLLNKKRINFKNFSSSIALAISSTFSILLGVVAWIIGFIMLLKFVKERNHKSPIWISLWIISTVIIGIVYLSLVSNHNPTIQFENLFSFTTFSFIANFLASSFRLKYQILIISVGTISIILSGIFIYYLRTKQSLQEYFPWIAFMITTFLAAVITALGRMHLDNHLGNEPFYSTISQFFQIGLVVLCGKIILDLKVKPNNLKTNLIVYLLIALIIFQMVLLIPSYYSGWERAQYYFEQRMIDLNCFSPKPDPKCIHIPCNNCIMTKSESTLSSINHLIQNNYSIFQQNEFEKINSSMLEKFYSYDIFVNSSIIGEIIHINQKTVLGSNNTFEIENEFLQIDGWIKKSILDDVQKIYLKIDDSLLIEYDDFQISNDSDIDPLITNWTMFIMSGYIPEGCNSMSINILKNSQIISIDEEIILCK